MTDNIARTPYLRKATLKIVHTCGRLHKQHGNSRNYNVDLRTPEMPACACHHSSLSSESKASRTSHQCLLQLDNWATTPLGRRLLHDLDVVVVLDDGEGAIAPVAGLGLDLEGGSFASLIMLAATSDHAPEVASP